jgi:DNA replication protein DnaC
MTAGISHTIGVLVNGVGKSMIIKNIAHQAILAGHSVLFVTAARMLNDLIARDSPRTLEARIRSYSRIAVLCIDEVGYLSYDSRAADLLFEVVSRRHAARKPIVLSTNLAFKDWGTVFPNATCTVALVDRLTHRADVIHIQGDSWRRKEARERQARNQQEIQS